MAFFDIPKNEDIAPEAREALDELRRLRGVETLPASWRSYGRSPRILRARVTAEANLFGPPGTPAPFSWEARMIAFMLVAHARRCDGCFGASRTSLKALGFDEPALDGFCANPAVLPLPERERVFVKYVLRVATDPTALQPRDFRVLQVQGVSRDDVQFLVGFAAYSVFNTIFVTAANKALSDE